MRCGGARSGIIIVVSVRRGIQPVRCGEMNDKKKLLDLLNWIKSDLASAEHKKIGKRLDEYKIRFLRKLEKILNDE